VTVRFLCVFVIEIAITDEMLNAAEAEANRRQTSNEAKRLKGRNKAESSGQKALEMHRLGALGEIIVADYLGLRDQVFTAKKPVKNSYDLPGQIDVKTRPKHNYDLLVQIDDDPSKRFVLVTVESDQSAYIHGWADHEIVKSHAQVKNYRWNRPCYAIESKNLKPINKLLPILTAELGMAF